jgi:hypothetical protein
MRQILLLLISSLVFFTSCRKTDKILISNYLLDKQIVESFTTVPDYLNPSLQKIANYLYEKDKQIPFIQNIGSKVGLPLWDKAQFKKVNTHSRTARSNSNADSMVIIPLSIPNSSEVSGFITATLDQNNNIISVAEYDKFNYRLLGYNHSNNSTDAEDIVIQCLILQKEIFGISTFKLEDDRLFDTDNDTSNFRRNYEISLSEVNQSSTERIRVIVVKSNHCTHHDGTGPGGNDDDPDCDQCEWCGKFVYQYYFIIDDPIGMGDPNSGGIWGQIGGVGGWSFSGSTILNAVNFVSTVNTLDVGSINNIVASNNFKAAYLALEEKYKLMPVSIYSSMSRADFILLIQQNPSIARFIDPITLLVKLGANAASDVLMQVMVKRLTDPDVHTWGEAIERIDWVQVGATAISGLLPWNNPSSKFIVAGINGASAVISDIVQNGFQSWEQSGYRFIEGFCGSLIGNSVGDFIITKFGSVSRFGSLLVTKMGNYFPYKTICKWLGGGLSNVVETLTTTHGVISSVKTMVGFNPGKVCVIGRNMKDRVIPFAEVKAAIYFDEKNSIAKQFITPDVQAEWNALKAKYGNNIPKVEQLASKMYRANQDFIEYLKSEGYTFIDLGTGGATDFSVFYSMEISKIFD